MQHDHNRTGPPGAMHPRGLHALLHGPWFGLVHKSMVDELHPTPGEAILDVGCGNGELVRRIARSGANVIGVDPDERAIAEATARATSGSTGFIVASAEDLPIETASIDAATCSVSAHHWSDVERGIAEVARVVRPNGRLIFVELRPASPIVRFGRGLTSASHRDAREAREWRMLLQNAGFAAVNVAGTGLGARLVLLLTARRASDAALDGTAPTTDSGGVA